MDTAALPPRWRLPRSMRCYVIVVVYDVWTCGAVLLSSASLMLMKTTSTLLFMAMPLLSRVSLAVPLLLRVHGGVFADACVLGAAFAVACTWRPSALIRAQAFVRQSRLMCTWAAIRTHVYVGSDPSPCNRGFKSLHSFEPHWGLILAHGYVGADPCSCVRWLPACSCVRGSNLCQSGCVCLCWEGGRIRASLLL